MTQHDPGARRFLAVDDNPDSAELAARVAAKQGYEARWVSDPNQFREILADWHPEVMTLDLCMPQEDGLTLMSALEEARYGGLLVIISGQDAWLRKTAARLAAARGLRVVEDFAKPINIQAFGKLLSELRNSETPVD